MFGKTFAPALLASSVAARQQLPVDELVPLRHRLRIVAGKCLAAAQRLEDVAA